MCHLTSCPTQVNTLSHCGNAIIHDALICMDHSNEVIVNKV